MKRTYTDKGTEMIDLIIQNAPPLSDGDARGAYFREISRRTDLLAVSYGD